MNKKKFAAYIEAFDFAALLSDLGYTPGAGRPEKLKLSGAHGGDAPYTIHPIATKKGYNVLECRSAAIPDTATRRRIALQLQRRTNAEHPLVIYTDERRTAQVWSVAIRKPGQPLRHSAVWWRAGQDVEALYQRGNAIGFRLDESGGDLTIVDVVNRVEAGFGANADPVVRKFYTAFSLEHKRFYEFVKGIDDHIDRMNAEAKSGAAKVDNRAKQWYVSLMLNRLMFCYFIQKKGFLDNNTNYLRSKLGECRKLHGADKFYSFYRDFLLQLFHHGLGSPHPDEATQKLIGRIPYLNGGLFDVHELERQFEAIRIDDAAFDAVFHFFEDWNWHLDSRETASGKDINPDVIGYIFERYINDRAQMGAYYTKEDITEYIAKNCIIPWLWEEAARRVAPASSRRKNAPEGAFNTGNVVEFVKASGDAYIYPAVKKGVELDLPDDIDAGIKEVSKCTGWNRPAPAEYANPTEIWREVVARRQRYEAVMEKIQGGEIASITDFITYNLDLRLMVQQYIAATDDPQWLQAFYTALTEVTVLDPTCGSGAFLFAALNILEPLYQGCLERMRWMVHEEDERNRGNKRVFGHTLPKLRSWLAEVQSDAHPNGEYYVYKSIILRNLYGVDIMPEAVEIAKLRLFLKLVACVDPDRSKPGLGLEPLPDVDFNLRAGNTLVGYATEEQLRTSSLDFKQDEAAVRERMDVVSRVYERFREIQLRGDEKYADIKAAKGDYDRELQALTDDLDRSYYNTYGDHARGFTAWNESHQPFHWFAEFYGILAQERKGFDVVIGNPPYVGVRSASYKFPEMRGSKFSDLYAHVIMRVKTIISRQGTMGMIVPLSLTFSEDFGALRKSLTSNGGAWFSSYDNIPASVFAGVSQRCTIWIALPSDKVSVYVSQMYRWRAASRPTLMTTLQFAFWQTKTADSFGIPKIADEKLAQSFQKLLRLSEMPPTRFTPGLRAGSHTIGFSQAARNFISIFLEAPPNLSDTAWDEIGSTEVKFIKVNSQETRLASFALLTSDISFWYWLTRGDGFHVTGGIVCSALTMLNGVSQAGYESLTKLGTALHAQRNEALVFKLNAGKYVGNYNYRHLSPLTRRVDLLLLKEIGCSAAEALNVVDYVQRVLSVNEYAGEKGIPPGLKSKYPVSTTTASKHQAVLGEIDRVIAKHYGFTEKELDFIVNYDIGYGVNRGVQTQPEETEKIVPLPTFKPRPLQPAFKPSSTSTNQYMKEFTHDEGIYTVNDVEHIVKINASKVRRWFKDLLKLNYEGLSQVQQGEASEFCISFYGLIELVVIDHLRKENFSLKNIWKARRDLAKRTGKIYPFATNNVRDRMKISGRDLVFIFDDDDFPVTLDGPGRNSGQFNFEFIREFFRAVDFDGSGLASRLYPYPESRLIVVDPKLGGGKAAIDVKGTWTEVIASFYTGPQSIPSIASQFDLTSEEIKVAVAYMN